MYKLMDSHCEVIAEKLLRELIRGKAPSGTDPRKKEFFGTPFCYLTELLNCVRAGRMAAGDYNRPHHQTAKLLFDAQARKRVIVAERFELYRRVAVT